MNGRNGQKTRVLVIGAGPAGMMAAGQAAEGGAETLLLEGMGRPGRKLLMTGGGRCNIGNTVPRQEFIARFGKEGRFLYQAFGTFFREDLAAFFAGLGLPLVADGEGKIYPNTGRATDVLRVLRSWLTRVGVTLVTNTSAKALVLDDGIVSGVRVLAPKGAGQKARPAEREYPADAVILATGGASYPSTGSTGVGYRIAEAAGHTIVPIRPALVPLVSSDRICQRLQGVALEDVELSVRSDGRKMGGLRGAVLFTHYGISGPGVLSLSTHAVDALREKKKVEIIINFVPGANEEDLGETLRRQAADRGRQLVRTILGQWVPDGVAAACCERAGVPHDRKGSELTAAERRRLASQMTTLTIGISGHRSLKEAMVTAGGVALGEIDPRTMMSRLVRNLYFAGEIIDLHGDTGGFNLQAAFSTGWLAGRAATGALEGRGLP